ncbi:flagellar basal body-associated protein FliL [Tatumella sp. UBA2305]|uniref:flagellar basal body-associated protein FliL n=1 Tax=Tatumella sp. UBA2305 TaxID=1947647 RepID=UPI0025F0410D|nr:flagellar basal body-associated protein FliL [Tatumella sp. UBA2305]
MTTLPKKKTGKKLLLRITLCVITLAACGAAAFSYLQLQRLDDTPATGATAPVVTPPASPVFLPLEAFTVNLSARSDNDDERVLYAGFTLRLPDEATRERLNQYLPEVRSRLILLLTSQNQHQLETEQGKQQLADSIKTALTPPLVINQPPQQIDDVLFTSFILR